MAAISPVLWATFNGTPVGDGGAILTVESADIVLSEVDRFSTSKVSLFADDKRTILAMKSNTLIEVGHPGEGTIAYGYILNPQQQLSSGGVNEEGRITYTLELYPTITELSRRNTHRGWVSTNKMSDVFNLLVAPFPGWVANFLDKGLFDSDGFDLDPTVSATFGAVTYFDAVMQFKKQFGKKVRFGPIAPNSPTRTLEMGNFLAPPTVTLVSANGGDPELMRYNNTIRLVADINYQPEDITNLVTVTTPFGGGSDDASLVNLERLYAILNDPSYPNYGRYGTDAESIARTGKPSLFKEYDPNYPISNPENPPTGQIQWLYFTTDGVPILDPSLIAILGTTILPPDNLGVVNFQTTENGVPISNIVSALSQGAKGTRFPTRDGHWDYMVYDKAAYEQHGHYEKPLQDSTYTYQDGVPANQELTEIGLYLAAIANFERNSHPHHLFTCTAPAILNPPRGGDLINVEVQHSHISDTGAIVEMSVIETFVVQQVRRAFPAMMDTYLLSNLGRFEPDDAEDMAAVQQQIIAFQLRQDTSVAPFPMTATGNCDTTHPFIVKVPIPKQLFRWRGFSVQCDPLPYTATSETADNQTQDFSIFTGPQDILLDTPNDINLSGGFDQGGNNLLGSNPGFDIVQKGVDNDAVIKLAITNDPDPNIGATPGNNVRIFATTGGYRLRAGSVSNSSGGALIDSSINFTKAKTSTTTTASLAKQVVKKFGTIARIAGTTILAVLPKHRHPLDKKIADNGPTAENTLFSIEGMALPGNARLMSGTRNDDGSFKGAFKVEDIGDYMNKPGETIELKFTPDVGSGNPYGATNYQITILGFGEFGLIGAAGVSIGQ